MSAFTESEVKGEAVRENALAGEGKRAKRFIITFDYGTSYSGVAIAIIPETESNLSIFCGAPSARNGQQKEPTFLLRIPGDAEEWSFGNKALEKYIQIVSNGGASDVEFYQNFKMELKGRTEDLNFKATALNGKKLSCLLLITKVLEILKKFAFKKLEDTFGRAVQIDKEKDIQWVITVPAIWNQFALTVMRKAAVKAGLIRTEASEDLTLALEPEAAAVGVQMAMKTIGLLTEIGTRMFMADNGGGTYDGIALEVVNTNPLELKTIWSPVGAACGGTYVNQSFLTFLKALLSITPVEEQEMAPALHQVNLLFEAIKVNYEKDAPVPPISIRDLVKEGQNIEDLAKAYNAQHPTLPIVINSSLIRGSLTLSPQLMYSFFLPLMEEAVAVTRTVLDQLDVKFIVMVGGNGGSKVVCEYFRDAFESSTLSVISPLSNPTPQAAIVYGAVYFGLYRQIITHRLSPYTYGVRFHPDIYKVLVHRHQELPVDHKVEISGLPPFDSTSVVSWKLLQSLDHQPQKASTERILGYVLADCPPGPTRQERKQTAFIEFGRSEVKVKIVNAQGAAFSAPIKLKEELDHGATSEESEGEN